MDAADARVRIAGPPSPSHRSGNPSDTLSDVLEAVRLTGALFFLVDAPTPWVAEAPASTHLAPVILPHAQHIVSYHVVSQGACWCESPGHTPLRLEAGDVLVVPHGHAYQLASTCGLRTGWSLDEALGWFRAMAGGQLPFVVTEGGGGPERLQLVCGFLGCDALPFNPVLTTLPALVRVRVHGESGARLHALLEFAIAESAGARPGSRSVLLRIAELVFVEVLRSYVTTALGRRRELAGRASGPGRRARAGAPARRTRSRVDIAGARTRGRCVTLRAGRAIHVLRRTSADALPDALADAARREPTRGRGSARERGRERGRLRVRGGVLPRVQESHRRDTRLVA